MWVAHTDPTDPTGFSRLMLNLTEASRTFAPCGSHRFNRLNKKNRGFRVFDKPQISTNFHKLFFVESCWICVSFGNRSTRSTRSTRICPRPFYLTPWDLSSSKAKSVRSAGSVWAKDMPHDHSINFREIWHHQKQNQWDLRDLCEPKTLPSGICVSFIPI